MNSCRTRSGHREDGSFFFPHNSDAAPWWQGENARLASLATAAQLAAKQFPGDPEFQKKLRTFALDQINWILGLNPFDSSMMYRWVGIIRSIMFLIRGSSRIRRAGFRTESPAEFKDEDDIDFDLKYTETGADNDWRWQGAVASAYVVVFDGGFGAGREEIRKVSYCSSRTRPWLPFRMGRSGSCSVFQRAKKSR